MKNKKPVGGTCNLVKTEKRDWDRDGRVLDVPAAVSVLPDETDADASSDDWTRGAECLTQGLGNI